MQVKRDVTVPLIIVRMSRVEVESSDLNNKVAPASRLAHQRDLTDLQRFANMLWLLRRQWWCCCYVARHERAVHVISRLWFVVSF